MTAGQVLVELDATNASADGASVQEQLTVAASEEVRTSALLAALDSGRPPILPRTASATARDKTQLQAEWSDITAKLAKLDAEQAHRQAEIVTVKELIKKIEGTLPISRQREADFNTLTQQGFMSSHAGQDRTRERIELESDLATQRARLSEAMAALSESAQARTAYRAETQRNLSERRAQASSKKEQFTQERSKTEQRSRLAHLIAPVDGTVQQVAVHTDGGVVTPAQVLMVIVPKDAQVPYGEYLQVLQVSAAHVYLTYPFVLSWSLLEAMACGAPILASETAPVQEVVRDSENGRLVSFFDSNALAARAREFLSDPVLGSRFRAKAVAEARNYSAVDGLSGYEALLQRRSNDGVTAWANADQENLTC